MATRTGQRERAGATDPSPRAARAVNVPSRHGAGRGALSSVLDAAPSARRRVVLRRPLRVLGATLIAMLLLGGVGTGSTEASALAVRFVSLPAAARGHDTTAIVATASGARCSIVVVYRTGPSTATGLTPKVANRAGRVSWTWRVGSNTTRGRWPVTVTCRKVDATGKATKYLVVG